MQKIYLLLRSNKQSGPHTLDELLSFGLKPHDLIWVEGRSAAWAYPSEIEALKPFTTTAPAGVQPLPSTATPGPVASPAQPRKHVFVSLPLHTNPPAQPVPAGLEQKAEALRQRALSAAPASNATDTGIVQTQYRRSLEEAETDYTNWVFQRRRKQSPPYRQLAAAGVLLLLLGAAAWRWSSEGSAPETPVQASVVEARSLEPERLPAAEVTASEETVTPSTPASPEPRLVAQQTAVEKKKPAVQTRQTEGAAKGASLPPSGPRVPTEPETTGSTAGKSLPEGGERESTTAPSPAPKQKKTFKEWVGGIFKKKEAPAPPAGGEEGGRTASRREESTTPSDLSSQVELKLLGSDENWMMGIRGARLTLYNRSDEPLGRATVEVRYYSEQKSLLQKTTLSFSGVAPRRSQIQAIPDHRLADHVEYSVLQAQGGQ
jgi:hypothetical protein